jgi:hypothetical protein
LWGIHAPEHNEPGGLVASRVMMALVGQLYPPPQVANRGSASKKAPTEAGAGVSQ